MILTTRTVDHSVSIEKRGEEEEVERDKYLTAFDSTTSMSLLKKAIACDYGEHSEKKNDSQNTYKTLLFVVTSNFF